MLPRIERRAELLSKGDLLPIHHPEPGKPGTPRIIDNGRGRYFVGRPFIESEQEIHIEYADDPERTLELAATRIRQERFGTPMYDNMREFPATRRLAYAAFEDTRPKYQSQHQAAEVRKGTEMEFSEYNGWVNRPTWDVFTVMTSYYETYDMLQRMASQPTGGRGAVRRAVLGSVEHWKIGKPTPHAEAARILVQDFLQHGIRMVEWTPVYDTLRGERKELGEADELTSLAYDLLSQTEWQSIVADAKYLTEADDMLRSWLEDQCFTWIESLDARKHTGSVSKFANTVLDIYFQAVMWEDVHEALKGK